MPVGMAVRFAAVPRDVMLMPVMLIMHVLMRVRRELVHMLVLMPLREVQPYAHAHQCGRRPERRPGALAEKPQGQRRAVEGRDRKICSSARGAEIAQRHDE